MLAIAGKGAIHLEGCWESLKRSSEESPLTNSCMIHRVILPWASVSEARGFRTQDRREKYQQNGKEVVQSRMWNSSNKSYLQPCQKTRPLKKKTSISIKESKNTQQSCYGHMTTELRTNSNKAKKAPHFHSIGNTLVDNTWVKERTTWDSRKQIHWVRIIVEEGFNQLRYYRKMSEKRRELSPN